MARNLHLGWFTYGIARGRDKVRAALLVLAMLLVWAGAPLAAAPVTVLALGDSLTAGYGLPRDQGLVPQLQRWLAARGHDVRLVNAGVSGDTTAGALARLDWSLSADIDAMIVTLGGNDMLRGLPAEAARANLRAILEAARAREVPVLLIGMVASRNYGPEYKRAFDAIYPDLATEFGTLYEPNFFQGLSDGSDDPAAWLKWMQRDGIHPDVKGVARIVTRIGPRVEALLARAAE